MASSMSVNPRWRHSHAHEGIFITVDDSRAQGTSQRGSQRHGRRGSRSTPPWTVPVPGRADPEDCPADRSDHYMSFHLEEVLGREFRIKMLPTTPKRRKGDRLDVSYQDGSGGIALIEMMSAAPDADATRRRNQEYLASIEANRAPAK